MGEGVLASKLIESCDICYQLLLYWMLDPQLAASLCKWLSQLEGRMGGGGPFDTESTDTHWSLCWYPCRSPLMSQ